MYIVLDKSNVLGGYVNVVCNEDGTTKFFDTEEEAQSEADDCQDATIVEI